MKSGRKKFSREELGLFKDGAAMRRGGKSHKEVTEWLASRMERTTPAVASGLSRTLNYGHPSGVKTSRRATRAAKTPSRVAAGKLRWQTIKANLKAMGLSDEQITSAWSTKAVKLPKHVVVEIEGALQFNDEVHVHLTKVSGQVMIATPLRQNEAVAVPA